MHLWSEYVGEGCKKIGKIKTKILTTFVIAKWGIMGGLIFFSISPKILQCIYFLNNKKKRYFLKTSILSESFQ